MSKAKEGTFVPKASLVSNPKKLEAANFQSNPSLEEVLGNGLAQENFKMHSTILNEDTMHYYNGQDCASLQSSNLKKFRELQEANDQLQRQIAQIDKDLKNAEDSLTLLAEKDCCLAILARNTGEIMQIQIDNHARLEKIAALEAENMRLKEEAGNQRVNFIDSREMGPRSKHAADFFLKRAKIERNSKAIFDLTQE